MTTTPLLHATGRGSTQSSVSREELEGLDCSVCLESLNGRSISYHPNGGENHPICTPCLNGWIAEKGYATPCPSCKKDLRETTIQEWDKDSSHPVEKAIYTNVFRRTIHYIKNNFKETLLTIFWLTLAILALVFVAL